MPPSGREWFLSPLGTRAELVAAVSQVPCGPRLFAEASYLPD